jgi:Protein of unknown function (DUF2911)
MRRIAYGMAAVLVMTAAASLSAQKTTPVHPGKGGSPHVRTEWTIDGASLSIEYGQPSLKGRTDAALMPNGQPWRVGADEATVLKTDKPLKFGTLTLEPGTYTLNAEPGEKQWQLIVGKLSKPGQWGVPYNASLEIGRAPMSVTAAKSPVEQLKISIDDTAKGGTLKVEWGSKVASIPFTVG